MTPAIVLTVLAAALLHAVWNAMIKGSGDKTVMLGLIALGHVVPGVAMAFLFPAPALEAVPYIIASTVIHWGYYYFLSAAYKFGDLSFVYPIARGTTPVMIAMGATIWADEYLSWQAWGGILIVSLGIITLVIKRSGFSGPALLAAVITSFTIAAYSIVDGIGIRLSGSPLGYIAWLFVAEFIVFAFVGLRFGTRMRALTRRIGLIGICGGVLSGAAYGLVLYAKMFAPLGIVSALRETSVVFAALIGVIWLHERPVFRRLFASVIVAFGIIVISL
ncbi:EamA-like transporter family protein [Roseovarius albus]|uniref:EamA-like transporter family protein n=1 Tax=Roseovarius albus TaxID=1247867 RepID=A0A1X6YIV3_9RHOB|nr:DMT family transporter [Roseovarius albus]SLN22554.1 EamA-like transporter family protein [Roseovarius albus]